MQDVISKYLTNNVKITKLADHTAAGTDPVTSAELDMAGFEGVVFLTSYGTANSANLVTVHASNTSGGEAATTTVCSSGSSDEDIIVDVINPGYRYLKLVATVGSSSTVESMWAIQYGARTKNQSSDTTGTSNVAQAEGLALA
jgi:hypothetical protein